jgi:hypothetical protein
MRKEKASLGIVRICVCVRELVMNSMISHPFVNVILQNAIQSFSHMHSWPILNAVSQLLLLHIYDDISMINRMLLYECT